MDVTRLPYRWQSDCWAVWDDWGEAWLMPAPGQPTVITLGPNPWPSLWRSTRTDPEPHSYAPALTPAIASGRGLLQSAFIMPF